MKKLIIFCLLFFMAGCSTVITAIDEQNTRTLVEVKRGVVLVLDTWDFKAGAMQEALRYQEFQISPKTKTALEDMSLLAEKYKQENTLTDFEYGRALVLIFRLKASIAERILGEYFPAIFQYIPGVL